MEIEGINHVCLVVRDRTRAEWFYGEVLGFAKHEKVNSWYTLCPSKSTLHIIEVTEAGVDKSWYHQVQHVAFQVPNLRKILATLLGVT
jgi:catechol 2,3-dioxygenase-like lactoylglutathione lyase family enzyme